MASWRYDVTEDGIKEETHRIIRILKYWKGILTMSNINLLVEQELSAKQIEYRKFFKEKLQQFNAKSPADLTEDDKKKFFSGIKAEWPDYKSY